MEIRRTETMPVREILKQAHHLAKDILQEEKEYLQNKQSVENVSSLIYILFEFVHSELFQKFFLAAFDATYHKFGVVDEITDERFKMKTLYCKELEKIQMWMDVRGLIKFARKEPKKIPDEIHEAMRDLTDSVDYIFKSRNEGFLQMFEIIQMYYLNRSRDPIEIYFFEEVPQDDNPSEHHTSLPLPWLSSSGDNHKEPSD